MRWQDVDVDAVAPAATAPERIRASIEALIDDESLRPGDRLPTERVLAGSLGVSRPSVREALRMLQARGRVDVRHGVGSFVADPPLERRRDPQTAPGEVDVAELFSMRDVLEGPSAAWAAERATKRDIIELKRILSELDNAFDHDPADARALARLDSSFHVTIAQIAANRFLLQMTRELHELLNSGMETTLLLPRRRETVRGQHDKIVDAIAAGDSTAASRATRAHVRDAHRTAERHLGVC